MKKSSFSNKLSFLFLFKRQSAFNFFSWQVDELRAKLEEKNKTIEKKTGAALHATQEKNRISNELSDLRDQIDIKDRKVNVLQRKVNATFPYLLPKQN